MLRQLTSSAGPELNPVAAVRMAAVLCKARGAQMTAMRCAVLEVLWRGTQPLGAYDLLARVQAKLGRKLTPPTIYRALDFLLEHRLIARIESRNAYVPCAHPERPHGCVFFVCNQCSTSVEIENRQLEMLMDKDAQSLGFRIVRRVVELEGTCAACDSASNAAPEGS
jgi:Fur family zinc uptake transcriptional regulator